MFKKLFLISILFIFPLNVLGAYYNSDTEYCNTVINSSKDFITNCPPDYRDESDWSKIRHFTTDYSNAKCVNGIIYYDDCEYTLENWTHPQVTGEQGWRQDSVGSNSITTQTEVPEYSTVGAAIALIGAGIIAYKKRK